MPKDKFNRQFLIKYDGLSDRSNIEKADHKLEERDNNHLC